MRIKKLDILNESEFRENVLLLGHNHHFAENIVLKTNGAASSFVITDIGGDIMTRCGRLFKEKGYSISLINLDRPDMSLKYNPLWHICEEGDIDPLVKILVRNEARDDSFLIDAERMLLHAIISFLFHHTNREDRVFSQVLNMISMIMESDEEYTPLDYVFEVTGMKNSGSKACTYYEKFCSCCGKSGKIKKKVANALMQKLSIFSDQTFRALTELDDMALTDLYEKNTVLFINLPVRNAEYDFLAEIIYFQLFRNLQSYTHKFPLCILNDIKMLMNQFDRVGSQIPDIESEISKGASSQIFTLISTQSIGALFKNMLNPSMDRLVSDCSSIIYRHAEEETAKWFTRTVYRRTVVKNSHPSAPHAEIKESISKIFDSVYDDYAVCRKKSIEDGSENIKLNICKYLPVVAP